MPNYLCLQRSLPTEEEERLSPAEIQALYANFHGWMETFRDNIVDPGGGLGEGRLVADRSPDGPFIEIKELVGGYMILTAETIEEAIAVARECPGLMRPGSGVEVVEIETP